MSLQYRVAEQVLTVADDSESTLNVVHKYDAFLNLLCSGKYAFQKDAVHAALAFMMSEKYPDIERLALENFNSKDAIRRRNQDKDKYLAKFPLRDRKSVSIDLATGTGKSYVLYALAAIALAEGLVDKVLVLCPSLTIEDGLREKFGECIGSRELTGIMKELGAAVATPGLKRGSETVEKGDICVENIHAVYERTGSSIYDSFHGQGARTLVLNDEAHHIFSEADKSVKKWMEFLCNPEYGFRYIVNVTGTAYIGNEYFPDVVYRYGLKKAIEEGVVKKPNYKESETMTKKGFQETYAIHEKNRKDYGHHLKPISIVVTENIAGCVEVWNELVDFLMKKQKIGREEAEKKCIWVASGIPSGHDGERVKAIVNKPEKKRRDNVTQLKQVDGPDNPVEWIVSVSMLTEGWDVKNVFQIVPHESRAFNSKLLIAQVLGRGLRVPPGLDKQPLVTINNHESWSGEIQNLLREVLEIENQLGWGYIPERSQYVFPLHNLRYEPQEVTVQTTKKAAREPDLTFKPQARATLETSVFSETGTLTTQIENPDVMSIDAAVKQMKIFLNEKDSGLAAKWPNKRLRSFIVEALKNGRNPSDFLSRENFSILQQAFSPMFRKTNEEHPRLSQRPDCIEPVDLTAVRHQTFSESILKEHGTVYYAKDAEKGFDNDERNLWQQYQKFKKLAAEFGEDGLNEDASMISRKLVEVDDPSKLKSPWNLLYASHDPERLFLQLLIEHSDLFAAFVKIPDKGTYSFPYSYKSSHVAKTHVTNENFNPDYFLRLKDLAIILVVEIKSDEDRDRNRNAAKYRDGTRHFETLNVKLEEIGEPWRYHFYFLSPEDYTQFFQAIREGRYAGWKSSLMLSLKAEYT
jgi:type III restriction enzyme